MDFSSKDFLHFYPKKCVFSSLKDIENKHITIMGLGLNGGGLASVKFFLQHGAFVTVTDMKTAEQLKPTIEKLNNDKTIELSKLTYRLGMHCIEDFSSADCVIKNPGVKFEGNKYLVAAKAIETDLSIFLTFTKAPIIAITGSKGKSSTASAIHYGLCKAGFDSFLGGNITVSPLTFLEKTSEKTPVVLELSSWQLADLRGRDCLKPFIALITKIVPDHQNWYGNMESYIADKRLIYKNQTENDFTILDADSDEVGTEPKNARSWGDLFASETKAKVLCYSKEKLKIGVLGAWQENNGKSFVGKVFIENKKKSAEVQTVLTSLSVPGKHMQANVLNAALVMSLMHIEPKKIESILGDWQGIEHRLQFFYTWNVPSYNAVFKFYNDSCSTVPESAAAASQAFGKKVFFITGGTDKGLDFSVLADTLLNKEKKFIIPHKVYLLAGSGTDKLLALLDGKVEYSGPFNSLNDLLQELKTELIKMGQANSLNGVQVTRLLSSTEIDNKSTQISASQLNDIQSSQTDFYPVVFSPGATSFGMFSNEFDRGNKFMEEVKKIFKNS